MTYSLQDYTDKTLNPTSSDRLASFIRAITDIAIIPGTNISLSNTLGELVFPFIKDQWQERATHIMSILAREIDRIPKDRLNQLSKLDWCANLFEEGILTALKTYSEERRKQIAFLIINSLSEEKLIIEESIALLRILASMNDSQVILLKYHANISDNEFYNAHKEIISGKVFHSRVKNGKNYSDRLVQKKYIKELVNNDLLLKTNAPAQTANSGYYHVITELGTRLLELISETKQDRND